MRFTYTYRSSDGQRHSAEIEAESRDVAFERVRTELGIKPIKVVAAAETIHKDGGPSYGHVEPRPSTRGKLLTIAFVAIAALAAIIWWWGMKRSGRQEKLPGAIVVQTPQGAVTLSFAEPLPRQTIPGNRQRIDGSRDSVFTNAAERLLARYAEPGRPVPADIASNQEGHAGLPRPSLSDFTVCLREPIQISSADFTEVVDLKRIVTGMKREMRMYLAGGGTVEQYLSELAKRQKLEVSYRENAEKRLFEMLSQPPKAYAYWLKANASLKSMGIYELPLPDALQSYQAGLDLDE